MAPGSFRFERFSLDPRDRQLLRNDAPVVLTPRYLDALILLVREHGQLVSKDRFLDEVWRGAPVTDEALTQCIRTLRRQLGDDAGSPRFIATAPKHGYRFIAPVEWVEHPDRAAPSLPPRPAPSPDRRLLQLGAAGTIGGGAAGALGGLAYGLAGAAQSLQAGVSGLSVLLVLVCLTLLIGLLGGAGVGFGLGATSRTGGRLGAWSILGGAAGGLIVGALVKLLGLDAFDLLFGHTPGDITGAFEGALLGGAIGLGGWLGSRGPGPVSLRRATAAAGLAGAGAGALIPLLGGRLMGGSLDLLIRQFPASRLRLDQIGALLGESGFGPVSQTVTSALEGGLFGAFVIGAMILARRRVRSGVSG